MSPEHVSTHYVLRYVYAILVIITIAVTTVLVTLYVAQQDEKATHLRVETYHLESASEADEVRREVAMLRRQIHESLDSHVPHSSGLAGVRSMQVSSTGLVQSITARLQKIAKLERQFGGSVFAAMHERMLARLDGVNAELKQERGPTEDTLLSIDVLSNTIEQVIRLHKIEARRDMRALASRQDQRPQFLAVLIASLVFMALVGGYLVFSLRSSMARRFEAELALAESQERLHHIQKLDALGRLVGGVAHDFNNLLTVILGHIEILLLTRPNEEALKSGLGEIKKAGDQASSLTQQLLAFSRRQQLQPKVLCLNDQVAGLEPLMRRIISEDVKLNFEYEKNPCAIEVDPDQLRQIIMNLAGNARDAMPEGGRLEISTACIEIDGAGPQAGDMPHGKYMSLVVEDTGIGMSEDVMQRIFEPFFTTKEESRGTGLGLSTVHGVVSGSDGYIRVDSTEGEGTTFYIYFPCSDKDFEGESDQSGKALPQRGSETVLVVEDEPSVLQFVELGLTSLGYTVMTATSGPAGLEICIQQAAAIDVILSDIVMPDMNGPEFMEKALERCPNAAPIFMSAYTKDEALRAGNAHDIDIPLVNKPFKLEDLVSLIRERLVDRTSES